jgi:hypothetical protein
MNEETVTDASAREFLLGKLDDEARARVEDLFLTDARVRERVLVAEQDLIEDYLEGNLTSADREIFVSRYTETPEQRQKLRITESIKRLAAAEAESSQIIAAQTSGWHRLRARLRLRPALMAPIAIILLMAIVITVWLSRREQRSSIEQELAQLNTPASLREAPAQMVSLELSPVTVRSAESVAELKTSAGTRLVELRLPWIRAEHYSLYEASIQRLGGGESYTIPDLQAESNGKYVRFRLPAHLLRRGEYQIQLSGIGPDGVAGPAEEYQFTVGG